MPQIRAKRGFPRGGVFPLGDRELTIGRDPESDIRLELDSPASRHHATVYKVLNVWHVKDLGSLNGTELNGTLIKDQTLKNGDTITIGEAVFVFEDSDVPASKSGSRTSGNRPLSPEDEEIQATVREMSVKTERLKAEISKAIIGQKEIVSELLTAIISNGHVLMIGMPGLAKTMMIRTVAEVLDLQFRRIQFTPDLMPSDITGTDILEVDESSGRKEYRFIKGPIFTNILLADEINRTPPKTQAALLQAMQEREVSVGQETYSLPDPFFTIATQNPIEQEGTYPLPEAQLDRFMFNIKVGYPSASEEEQILMATTRSEKPEVRKVLSGRAIVNIQKLVGSVAVSEYVVKYVARLVRATRPKDPQAPTYVTELVDWGAGPRAGQFLIQGGKAMAAMSGRFSVSLEDIRRIAVPVLRHRIATNFQAQADGLTSESIIERLVRETPEPEIPKLVK